MTVDAHQEKLSFQTEVKQLLQLVVHSLYSNKEIFLRELISNASDAADKLRFEALSDPALYEANPDLAIHVAVDKNARTITIRDNGIGMSREEVIDNLGTIAKSGTREFLAKLTGDSKKDAHLIGQFGVGFYSAFIVAGKVTVITRRAGLTAEHGVRWESSGDGEYIIANMEKATRGTDIVLHLKEGEDEFLTEWRLRSIITKYSDHINIPILMPKLSDAEEGKEENKKDKAAQEWETVNKATALWTLPKASITQEQYKEFYKHISHDFAEPLLWAHNKVEGESIDYISVLFVPAHAPMDLWHRDKPHGLKLYVQRVFIMDHVEQFMPYYLRFIRGIIDTSVLPLNISREILQDHPAVAKLRSALTKRVLDLLEKLANEDAEKYSKFWEQFGNVLKEGPAEDFANREKIAKLLRFSSTHADVMQQTVSLEDYVKRMRPEQKKIYYITAETFNAAKSSPQLEIFRKNNIEVLLLNDRIDEWLIGHLSEFAGKSFQSAAKGDLELDELTDNKSEKEQQQAQDKKLAETFGIFIGKVKALLGSQVKDVRLSHRLTFSPACLVRDASALGPQMERLLKAAGQPVEEAKPILELNPEHTLVKRLQAEHDESQLKIWAQILLDQAILSEGGQLQDPAAFVQRINQLWAEMLS
ncbi:MAG: molecular chaperone HtpG [Gammaproteobacteria bacterium RIFCSPHIGHO2_12_FULL_41_20]|nr:MAG: molecular chaperone HtpG [Gammaproteobacteria bacterium RIFCSPHIGHO2_12_FULL_41_20]